MLSSCVAVTCGSWCTNTVYSPSVEIVYVERLESSTSLCSLPEDVMRKKVLSFVTFDDVVRLDSALANRQLRNYLCVCLNRTVLHGVVDFRHVDWCRVRKFSVKTLRITSAINNQIHIDAFSFEVLQVYPTAKMSELALYRLLTSAKSLNTLDVQSFYLMRLHHILPLDVDLPLLEINATGNTCLDEDTLVALVKRCPQLRVIHAMKCCPLTKRFPLTLAEHCPILREAYLHTRVRDEAFNDAHARTGFCKLFQSCRQLQVVDCADYFTVTNLHSLASSCNGLTSVTLQGSFYFQSEIMFISTVDSALSALVQNNPHIHTLKLSHFQRFGDVSLLAVAQCLPDLHTFILNYCEASVFELAAIRESCTKLTTFEVYRHLCPLSFISVFVYDHLSLSMIAELNIYCTTLSDAQLVTIAQANPRLHTLHISISYFGKPAVLTSAALCEASSYLHDLKKFSVGLQDANYSLFYFSVRLKDSALYALVQHCPKLTTINIPDHVNLSYDAIGALCNLPLLRNLNARQCVNLSDSSLAAIAEGCPLLEEIHLSHCPLTTNVGINALAQYSRKLTSVRLERCGNITNSSIQNLIRHARDLKRLDIMHNPLLTFAAVAELPQYCFCVHSVRLYESLKKPLMLEFSAAYRSNRHYFDVVFGWSEEFRANLQHI